MKAIWWVVVCDAARARVFETSEPGARMSEVDDWIEPAGRMTGRELDSDRPGRAMDRARGGRHAMDPPTDPHDKVEARFADWIVERLEVAHRAGRFEKLALIAPPAMLGRLRPAISRALARSPELEWDRDLTHLSSREIEEHLAHARDARRGSAESRG